MRGDVDGTYLIEGVVLLTPDESEEMIGDIPVLGDIDHLPAIIKRERVQEVIFSTDRLPYDKMLSAVANSLGSQISFKMVPTDLDVVIGKATIDYIDDIPFVDLDYRLHAQFFQSIKRSFDMVLALILMIVTSPLYLMLRLNKANKLQARHVKSSGKHSVVTHIFPRHKIKFWWFLPMLPTIIKGDLSFVGRDVFYELENDSIGFSLKPGLTGLEHVNRRSDLTTQERNRYHLYYLKNYSPLLDIEIILKTILKKRF